MTAKFKDVYSSLGNDLSFALNNDLIGLLFGDFKHGEGEETGKRRMAASYCPHRSIEGGRHSGHTVNRPRCAPSKTYPERRLDTSPSILEVGRIG